MGALRFNLVIGTFVFCTLASVGCFAGEAAPSWTNDWQTHRHQWAVLARKAPVCDATAATTGTFPSITTGQTSCTLSIDETALAIGNFVLTDHFTLYVDSDVDTVNFIVDKFQFGAGTTIELSAPQNKPATPITLPADSTQAETCVVGHPGGPGGWGSNGQNGISFSMKVNTIQPSGSLWIHTDGQPGGDGGPGQQGQMGGGGRGTPWVQPNCGNQPGGYGGAGGNGGNGGNTSLVKIDWAGHGILPVQCAQVGPTQSPPTAGTGAGGTIIDIWGGPGAAGVAGKGGAGGPGGYEGAGASAAGQDGLPGNVGICSRVGPQGDK